MFNVLLKISVFFFHISFVYFVHHEKLSLALEKCFFFVPGSSKCLSRRNSFVESFLRVPERRMEWMFPWNGKKLVVVMPLGSSISS